MRSIPMQFWPADWKVPRNRISTMLVRWLEEMSSRRMAGSLPPSSAQTGVRALAADDRTEWATGWEPMKVMCDMSG